MLFRSKMLVWISDQSKWEWRAGQQWVLSYFLLRPLVNFYQDKHWCFRNSEQGWGSYLLSQAAWIHYHWRGAKSFNFTLKFYRCPTMRKSDFSWLTIEVPASHEFGFDAMLRSNLSNENSDAGRIKCLHGSQVPQPCFRLTIFQQKRFWNDCTQVLHSRVGHSNNALV